MPDALLVLLVLAVAALAVAVYVCERRRIATGRRLDTTEQELASLRARLPQPVLPTVTVDDPLDPEATALATLRHQHRFGPKNGDGIRLCRCGDRHLDSRTA